MIWYRGYPIEDRAKKSSFLEVDYLLSECPQPSLECSYLITVDEQQREILVLLLSAYRRMNVRRKLTHTSALLEWIKIVEYDDKL